MTSIWTPSPTGPPLAVPAGTRVRTACCLPARALTRACARVRACCRHPSLMPTRVPLPPLLCAADDDNDGTTDAKDAGAVQQGWASHERYRRRCGVQRACVVWSLKTVLRCPACRRPRPRLRWGKPFSFLWPVVFGARRMALHAYVLDSRGMERSEADALTPPQLHALHTRRPQMAGTLTTMETACWTGWTGEWRQRAVGRGLAGGASAPSSPALLG